MSQLHVAIVGGGFGGAACAIACARQGMKVTLLEQASQLLPIGDSIGFGSNVVKLFKRWGMYDDLWAIASRATTTVAHDFRGDILGIDHTIGESEARYGHAGIIGHRGGLHMIFIEHCKKNGVDIRLGNKIKRFDPAKPSVTLPSGEELKVDAVIASDGVKSFGREQVLGSFDKPIHSGYAVYRAYSTADAFKNDELARQFVNNGDCVHVWVGPDMHGFVTSQRNGQEINAVLTHKDVADIDEGWSVPGKRKNVLKLLSGWDPAFVRVWEKIDNILDWKLVYRPCLEKWVSDSGLIAIVGDAAHPFLPTSTQGASQAIEDAATVALCLAKAGKGNVPLALHTYFELRHDYVAKAQMTGITQREKWHNAHDKESGVLNPKFDILAKGLLDSYYLWENDCDEVVETKWDEVSATVRAKLQ